MRRTVSRWERAVSTSALVQPARLRKAVLVGRELTSAGCKCVAVGLDGSGARRVVPMGVWSTLDMTPGKVVQLPDAEGVVGLGLLSDDAAETTLAPKPKRFPLGRPPRTLRGGWLEVRTKRRCPHAASGECNDCPLIRIDGRAVLHAKAEQGRRLVHQLRDTFAPHMSVSFLEPIGCATASIANQRRVMEWDVVTTTTAADAGGNEGRNGEDTGAVPWKDSAADGRSTQRLHRHLGKRRQQGPTTSGRGGGSPIPQCWVATISMKRAAAGVDRWLALHAQSEVLRASMVRVQATECPESRWLHLHIQCQLPPHASQEEAEYLWNRGAPMNAGTTLAAEEASLCEVLANCVTPPLIENLSVTIAVTSPRSMAYHQRRLSCPNLGSWSADSSSSSGGSGAVTDDAEVLPLVGPDGEVLDDARLPLPLAGSAESVVLRYREAMSLLASVLLGTLLGTSSDRAAAASSLVSTVTEWPQRSWLSHAIEQGAASWAHRSEMDRAAGAGSCSSSSSSSSSSMEWVASPPCHHHLRAHVIVSIPRTNGVGEADVPSAAGGWERLECMLRSVHHESLPVVVALVDGFEWTEEQQRIVRRICTCLLHQEEEQGRSAAPMGHLLCRAYVCDVDGFSIGAMVTVLELQPTSTTVAPSCAPDEPRSSLRV